MILLQADSLHLSFGDRKILNGVSIRIPQGGRTALSGANGSGKSTLLQILAGERAPEGGTVNLAKNTRLAYLPQSAPAYKGRSLYEELETAYQHIMDHEARIREIGAQLERADSDNESYPQLLGEHDILSEKIASSSYYQRDKHMYLVLEGLGFHRRDADKACSAFSGGWQMRIALAKTLLSEADVLLLDEPTNYLDLEARQWLSSQLQRFTGGVLMVSHDRGFLDQSVNQVAELFLGDLKLHGGNYSKYECTRRKEMEQLIGQYERQQAEARQIEDFIRRFRANSSKASLVQSRIKQLEKMEMIQIPESLRRIRVNFPEAERSGDQVLIAENIEKSYGDLCIYKNLDLELSRGDKAVLLGPNGVGKSTLLKIIASKDRDFRGSIRFGSKVHWAYFAQESEDQLSETNTVIEEAQSQCPTDLVFRLRSMLGTFLFRGDDIYKNVSVLSGGERNRLALVKMLLNPSNFLILDEPTNHLDLASKEVLLEALRSYGGTIMFVSHDEFFIRALANRVIELSAPGSGDSWRTIHSLPGNYQYYLDYRSTYPREHKKNPNERPEPPKKNEAQAADYLRSRQLRGKIEKLRRIEDALTEKIATMEEKQQSIQRAMGLEKNYSDGKIIRRLKSELNDVEQSIEKLHCHWEEAATELSELENMSR